MTADAFEPDSQSGRTPVDGRGESSPSPVPDAPRPVQTGDAFARYRDFALVALGGLLSILGGAVTNAITNAEGRARSDGELYERRVALAVEAHRELSASIDGITATGMRAVAAGALTLPLDSFRVRLAEYQRARVDWDLRYSRNRLIAVVFFGDSAEADVRDFNDRVAWLDRTLADLLSHRVDVHQARNAGTPTIAQARYEDAYRSMHTSSARAVASLTESAFWFERTIAAYIQARSVGGFDPLADLRNRAPTALRNWGADTLRK
jgi:hypothetical protein